MSDQEPIPLFLDRLPHDVACVSLQRYETGGGLFGFELQTEPPRFAIIDATVSGPAIHVRGAGPLAETEYDETLAARQSTGELTPPIGAGAVDYHRELSQAALPFRVDRIVNAALPLVLWPPTRD